MSHKKHQVYQDVTHGRYVLWDMFWISDKNMVREIELLFIFLLPSFLIAEIFIAYHTLMWSATFLRWGHVSSSCQHAGSIGDVCYFWVADSRSGTRPPLPNIHSNWGNKKLGIRVFISLGVQWLCVADSRSKTHVVWEW